jgi:polyhydroxyalkanoate synthesis regulator phasin
VVSELGGAQMSTLLESLPGIANVLRSPVADALVGLIRAGAGIGDFSVEDAEEMVRYATRRGLLDPEEGERVLDDIHEDQKEKSRSLKKAKAAKKSRATKAAPTRKK